MLPTTFMEDRATTIIDTTATPAEKETKVEDEEATPPLLTPGFHLDSDGYGEWRMD